MANHDYDREKFHGNYDGTSVTITITMALSFFNGIELLLLIFSTFSKWKGLYFWSLVIATIGVLSSGVGLVIEYFSLAVFWLGIIFDSCGWVAMVTGQSVVLYSRLGLILANKRILRAVKYMIIFDAVVFHITTNILNYGAHFTDLSTFDRGYFYIEFVQMTVFCIQEFIISGLYLWKTIKLLNAISREGTRRVMYQLFILNAIIIVMDIGLLAVQYKNLHIFEQCLKVFIYSVKLKLEFAILGKLVDVVQESQRNRSHTFADLESYVDTSMHASSPAHERQASLRSHANRTPSNDKSSIHHFENKQNGYLEAPVKFGFPMRALSSEISQVDLTPAAKRRREGRESDLMYADVLRSIQADK